MAVVGSQSSHATLRGSLTNTCRKHATYFFYRAAHPVNHNIIKPFERNIAAPVQSGVHYLLRPVKAIWSPISAWKDRLLSNFLKKQEVFFRPFTNLIRSASYSIKASYYKALIKFSKTEKRHKKLIELAIKGFEDEVLTYTQTIRLLRENIAETELYTLVKIDAINQTIQLLFDPEPMLRQVYIQHITNKIKAPQLRQWLTDINLKAIK